MDFAKIKHLIKLNSPAIMTGLGVAGVILTAASAVKATLEAQERIELAELMRPAPAEPLTKREKLARVWPLYIPTAVLAGGSIACILGAHNINVRRQAAVVTLYQIAERGYEEYRTQVVDKIGEAAEQKIRDSVAEKQLQEVPIKDSTVFVTGTGDSLFFDGLSGRYFTSSMETVRRAENDMNYLILHEMYATLNVFYGKLGLAGTDMGEDVGWDTDHKLEIFFTTMISDDNRPCMVINYRTKPIQDFGKWR